MPKTTSLLLLTSIVLLAGVQLMAQPAGIPRDTTYNVARVHRQIQRDFPYAFPAKDSVPAGVVAERDLVYATMPSTRWGKRELHADVFRPAKAGKYPALIMVHGGGWRSGNKSMQVPMAEMIAQRGFVTVAVEYQLSLEAPYPAAVYNIKAAIRWMRANADAYGIDPNRIAISGCSAGGHLAALVGLTNGVARFEGDLGNPGFSSAVQAILNIDGVVDFLAPSSLNKERAPDSADLAWLGGSFAQKPEIWQEASPIFWANERSVPMLFLNSGFSRFHSGQDELIGILNEWGVYHEVYPFNVKVHPFWLFHPWVDETVNYMTDFMRKVLK
ncbi:MAG: alpha/beta hydrolase [Haliscomenobacter sp.]|nr:alpha/beta hydrolase [Haliscomenobacter sp.]MBP9077763.1 alpha/beta hydrolase [Haliscomenobacter sp.]MBP9874348.1 alpha/beta hydrolase [Haliscomenobacter sp.]